VKKRLCWRRQKCRRDCALKPWRWRCQCDVMFDGREGACVTLRLQAREFRPNKHSKSRCDRQFKTLPRARRPERNFVRFRVFHVMRRKLHVPYTSRLNETKPSHITTINRAFILAIKNLHQEHIDQPPSILLSSLAFATHHPLHGCSFVPLRRTSQLHSGNATDNVWH
jgi:hypothetical protein